MQYKRYNITHQSFTPKIYLYVTYDVRQILFENKLNERKGSKQLVFVLKKMDGPEFQNHEFSLLGKVSFRSSRLDVIS